MSCSTLRRCLATDKHIQIDPASLYVGQSAEFQLTHDTPTLTGAPWLIRQAATDNIHHQKPKNRRPAVKSTLWGLRRTDQAWKLATIDSVRLIPPVAAWLEVPLISPDQPAERAVERCIVMRDYVLGFHQWRV